MYKKYSVVLSKESAVYSGQVVCYEGIVEWCRKGRYSLHKLYQVFNTDPRYDKTELMHIYSTPIAQQA